MELVEYEIKIPREMKVFLTGSDKRTELQSRAMLLYPYIYNQTISHGRAAELLGMNKYDCNCRYNAFDFIIENR